MFGSGKTSQAGGFGGFGTRTPTKEPSPFGSTPNPFVGAVARSDSPFGAPISTTPDTDITPEAVLLSLSTELKKIVALTETGMKEWTSSGGEVTAESIQSVVVAARSLADANAKLWKDVYLKKAEGLREQLFGSVGRMEGLVGIRKEKENDNNGEDIAGRRST